MFLHTSAKIALTWFIFYIYIFHLFKSLFYSANVTKQLDCDIFHDKLWLWGHLIGFIIIVLINTGAFRRNKYVV